MEATRARGTGLVGGVAEIGALQLPGSWEQPAQMARLRLRKLLRYGGVALFRHRAAPRVYAGRAASKATEGMVSRDISRPSNPDIIEMSDGFAQVNPSSGRGCGPGRLSSMDGLLEHPRGRFRTPIRQSGG